MKLRMIREMALNHFGHDMDGRGAFNARDQKAIKGQKVQAVLKQWLDKRSRQWNFLFLDSPRPYVAAQEYLVTRGIQSAGSITIVKDKSSGDVFTPWMILHVAGHAITIEHPEIVEEIGEMLARLVDGEYDPDDWGELPEYAEKLLPLLPFKSARDRVLPDMEEIVREVIAFHIKNGRFRFNSNDPTVKKTASAISAAIDDVLDGLVGDVVVDDGA